MAFSGSYEPANRGATCLKSLEMRYGLGGQLAELIAKNQVTGDQITRYEYGVTLTTSAIASNDLLRAEIYPDAKDSTDRVIQLARQATRK